jgi:ABC-type Na+ transport system ATPase subunit NatA
MTTTTSHSPAIAAKGLRKAYGDKTVLDGIDLTVPAGTVFALLGPNGAGKTTAVKILSTLITADAGDLHVGGHDLATDPQAVRAAIGVTGQFSAVDGLITGEENMLLMADLHLLPRSEGRRTAAELLARFDLVEAAKKPVSTYSGGMKRRLDLAMTLVGNPRIIFLDEPTTGLDPRSRHNMWQIIRDLVSDGVTVFLTTQYLEEADELAHRDLDAALVQVSDIESVGRQALTEIREAVTGYREGSLATELDRARSALQAAGIDPVVRQSGPPLVAQTEALLGWVVREAVTNAIRHSGATRCEITVEGSPERVHTRIADNGHGAPSDPLPPLPGIGGTGLKGLTERLAAAGGSLEAGPTTRGGFVVTAELPVEPTEPMEPTDAAATAVTGTSAVRAAVTDTAAAPGTAA